MCESFLDVNDFRRDRNMTSISQVMGQRLNGYHEHQYRQTLRRRTFPAFDARHR